jgi:hypothetical protein
MWRRTPGAYRWVQEASTAIAMNSMVLASSTLSSMGLSPTAMKRSVHSGSSSAKGVQFGFHSPVRRRWSHSGVVDAAVGVSAVVIGSPAQKVDGLFEAGAFLD